MKKYELTNETGVVKGFKVFNPDWTCSPNDNTKQYTCPGKFEEDVDLKCCGCGMHFCKKAADCFNYYDFNPDAYGDIVKDGDKYCTNKLEIVREIPWNELLEIVNTGKSCTGIRNSGNYNSGNCNSGNCNSGNWNSGYCNSGNCNTGSHNSGNNNSGYYNSGGSNSGEWNSGNYNSGNCNSGDWNSGSWNTGDRNSGNCNIGHHNSGSHNSGNYNSGEWNSGNYNSGDWNKCDFSNGCFNTTNPKIYLFNKLSEWTYQDWMNSEARKLLKQICCSPLKYTSFSDMTDKEKKVHPETEITGGYLKKVDNNECAAIWWCGLSNNQKAIITSIPNFDKDIFKEITGIDIDEN